MPTDKFEQSTATHATTGSIYLCFIQCLDDVDRRLDNRDNYQISFFLLIDDNILFFFRIDKWKQRTKYFDCILFQNSTDVKSRFSLQDFVVRVAFFRTFQID